MPALFQRLKPRAVSSSAYLALLAMLLSLAACKQEPQPAPATPAVDLATTTVEDTPATPAKPAAPVPPPPMPPMEASDDTFVGWYVEREGSAQLQACGRAVPLPVADPTFLRVLKAKLGGPPQPVYVKLRVRLAAGSRLEVTSVQQFGVDETPVTDCPWLGPPR